MIPKRLKPYLPVIVLIAFFILTTYYYFRLIGGEASGSDLYGSIVTFIVGIVAIYLYIKQKQDEKRDAAAIVLGEIRRAERRLEQYKVAGNAVQLSDGPDPKLLTGNYWNNFDYLLVNDLDPDEVELVNSFYSKCMSIDQSIDELSLSNQLNAKSNAIHDSLVGLALSIVEDNDQSDDKDLLQKFDRLKKRFLGVVVPDNYRFFAEVPQTRIFSLLNSVTFVTTSTAGEKLKQIAGR